MKQKKRPETTLPGSSQTSGVQFEKYEWLQEIGKGSFGSVSKIKRRSDGRTLVWKELNYGKMSEKEKQMLVSEVNILREISHANVVRYYDRIIDRDHSKIFIVMEYCEGGDISTMIRTSRKEQTSLPEDMIWSILSQVLLALHACHTRPEGKILHRDLKPGNIFLDVNYNVKLGDFGLSRMMGTESVFAYTHVGTPYYMSPEQISDQKYNEKSDIWSLGCIIYEVAALRAPFEATTHYQLAMKIKSGRLDRIPPQYSDELMGCIKAMLSQDQNQRPSTHDLLQHEYVAIRIQESKQKDKYMRLKRREADLAHKMEQLKKKEEDVELQLVELAEQEAKLQQWALRLDQLESEQMSMDREGLYPSSSSQQPESQPQPQQHWSRRQPSSQVEEIQELYKRQQQMADQMSPSMQQPLQHHHQQSFGGLPTADQLHEDQ